jgi:hypothetical protein
VSAAFITISAGSTFPASASLGVRTFDGAVVAPCANTDPGAPPNAIALISAIAVRKTGNRVTSYLQVKSRLVCVPTALPRQMRTPVRAALVNGPQGKALCNFGTGRFCWLWYN